MRRLAVPVMLVLVLGAGMAAAVAQSEEPEVEPTGEAPPTWDMVIQAGANGWVAPDEPLPIRITLSSDLLLVGRLEAIVGGITSSQAVEIPAGGVKDYIIQAGAPGTRRQLRVDLIAEDRGQENVLESEKVTLRVPADDLVVAVIDAEPYESAIRSARSTPVEQELQLVRLGVNDIATLNSAVSYLVVPTAAMAEFDAPSIDAIHYWVERGGRLIGAAGNVSRVADPTSGGPFVAAGAVGMALGAGEVTAVNDFDALDAAAWSDLLRSVPQPGIVRVQDGGGFTSLVGAALSGRSASVPALPWLLAGILLFVVLVGPVNFIVLRAFGRPEWGWLTVPLLSALFVVGFWMIGRSQLQPFTVTHTSVVVESTRGAVGHSAFVLQVESGGEHELQMATGWSSEGQDFSGITPGVAAAGADGRATVTYDLEDLGVGAAQGAWTADHAGDMGFTLTKTDNGFDVVVANRTDFSFDIWGVVVDGLGWLASEDLLAQSGGSVSARPNSRRNPRYEPVILEAVQRRGFTGSDFYETEYQQVYPMAVFAEQMSTDLENNGVFFFGFTSDGTHPVAIDGKATNAPGRSLFVIEVPDDGSVLAARTNVRPRLLAVDGSSSVEQYYDEIFAYGAEAVYFHYLVPDGIAGGKISPGFTSLAVSEVYDWTRGEFVEFEWGDPLNLTGISSPTGEVVVRASRDADSQFFDESLTLSRFTLDWSQQ